MKEIYKDIKGYEKLYQVSNIGNVKSLYKNRLLKPSIENGYLYVILYKDKQPTHKRIHRLVAETFIDNPKNPYTDIYHITVFEERSDIAIEKVARKFIEILKLFQ